MYFGGVFHIASVNIHCLKFLTRDDKRKTSKWMDTNKNQAEFS